MPIKRRISKTRDLDAERIEELIEGPGTCLLAGCGYFAQHSGPEAIPGEDGGFYWNLSPAGQTVIRERMREDWNRKGAEIMAEYGRDCWALREFGEP